MRGRIRPSVHRIVGIGEHEGHASFGLLIPFALTGAHSAEIVDPERVTLSRCNRLKTHHDPLLLAWRDWKNPRAQQPIPHPFEQGRIPLASDDLFIDLARLIGIHRFTGDHLTVDLELEILESGALWQREHEIGFADSASSIHERLSDLVAQHTIREVHTHITALAKHRGRCNPARRHYARAALPTRRRYRTRPRTWRLLHYLRRSETWNEESDCQQKCAHVTPVEWVLLWDV